MRLGVNVVFVFVIVILEVTEMPVEKVDGGYRWGKHGKVYRQKWKAERQGRAEWFRKSEDKKTTKSVDEPNP